VDGFETSQTDHAGIRSSQTRSYASTGMVLKHTDARGNVTTTETDLAGRTVKVTDSAGNVTTNNWSGQAEALTYQRAIRALENYGMYELIPQLGQKLMQAIGPQCRFVQQYDPFTGEPSVICEPGQPPQDAYGPAMLSVLEYTARMYGVSLVRDTVVWGTCPLECRYTQALNGRSWEIVNSGHEAEAFVDGRKVFTAGPGLRITTDLDGNILGTACYLPDADPAQMTPQ